jgi:hypothetical protein
VSETTGADRCEEKVRGDNAWAPSRICGKPSKGEHDGKSMCGVHLRAVQMRAQRSHRYAEERSLSARNGATAEAACIRLDHDGIKARPYLDPHMGRYTGEVVVRSEDLAMLLDTLQEAQARERS